jgi:hypothetical protein
MGTCNKCFHQFAAFDDCTWLRILRIYDRLNQKTAIQFVEYVLEKISSRSRRSPDFWLRVPVGTPLARARQGHPPHLHQDGHTTAQRQDGEKPHRKITPRSPTRTLGRRNRHLRALR